ncbi:hypothetical protein [Tatumella terrea]
MAKVFPVTAKPAGLQAACKAKSAPDENLVPGEDHASVSGGENWFKQ